MFNNWSCAQVSKPSLITVTASLNSAVSPPNHRECLRTENERTCKASNRAHLSYWQAHVLHARALHSQRVLTCKAELLALPLPLCRVAALWTSSLLADWCLSLPSCCSHCSLFCMFLWPLFPLSLPLSLLFCFSLLVHSSCALLCAFLLRLAGMWRRQQGHVQPGERRSVCSSLSPWCDSTAGPFFSLFPL